MPFRTCSAADRATWRFAVGLLQPEEGPARLLDPDALWRDQRPHLVARLATRACFLHGMVQATPPRTDNYRATCGRCPNGRNPRHCANCRGKLQPNVQRGESWVCDQFVRSHVTHQQTFYDGTRVVHISSAEPYCPTCETEHRGGSRDRLSVHGTAPSRDQGRAFRARRESAVLAQGWES